MFTRFSAMLLTIILFIVSCGDGDGDTTRNEASTSTSGGNQTDARNGGGGVGLAGSGGVDSKGIAGKAVGGASGASGASAGTGGQSWGSIAGTGGASAAGGTIIGTGGQITASGAGGGGGEDAGSNSNTDAIAANETSYDGEWGGSTSQGKPIAFRVASSVITELFFSASVDGTFSSGTCKSSVDITIVLADPSKGGTRIKDGAFSKNDDNIMAGDTSYKTLTATFDSDTSVKGTLEMVSKARPAVGPYDIPSGCDGTASLTWSATRQITVPNYDGPWSGTTSQGKPFSFVVSGNKITSLSMGYAITGSCTREGSATITENLRSDIVGGKSLINGGSSSKGGSISAAANFDSPTTAAGELRFSLYDTQVQPLCSGKVEGSWTARKQ